MGITYYEWNVMRDRSGDARSGVFAALMLNMFCREAGPLGLVQASYFQPVTEGAIRVGPLTSELEPDGQVFALYAEDLPEATPMLIGLALGIYGFTYEAMAGFRICIRFA